MLQPEKTTAKKKKRGEEKAEVMEVIKVPERRRRMWQTRPAKNQFPSSPTAKRKVFWGSQVWSGRVVEICGGKCEKKIKELCLSFWSNTERDLNDLMCRLNIVFVWPISGN